jgi:serine-type D-Ala-D-Ala carboxypeptidase
MFLRQKVMQTLQEGVAEGVFPGAVLLVARGKRVLLLSAVGNACLVGEKTTMSTRTVFDLASLTKPLATTLVLMRMVDREALDLDAPIGSLLGSEVPEDKRGLTTRQLLSHRAGLPDWRPFFLQLEAGTNAERKRRLHERVLREPLV